MSSDSMEVKLHTVHGKCASQTGCIEMTWVMTKYGIYIIKTSSSDHEHLAAVGFLSWSSKELESPFESVFLHRCFCRNGCHHPCNTMDIVSTPMSRSSFFNGLLIRNCFLRETWKGIIFSHEPNCRFSFSISGYECRWHVCDSHFNGETIFF